MQKCECKILERIYWADQEEKMDILEDNDPRRASLERMKLHNNTYNLIALLMKRHPDLTVEILVRELNICDSSSVCDCHSNNHQNVTAIK